MNNRRTRSLPQILVGQFIVILLIVAVSLSFISYAQGYRFNVKNFRIIKTGVIYLITNPKNATVFINGREMSNKTPFSKVEYPGHYNIEIKAEGYHNWSETIHVRPEYVYSSKKIVLFRKDLLAQPLTDQNKIALLNQPVDSLATNPPYNLFVNSNEIWAYAKLVSRFSEPISKAIWYPDYEHILFQIGREIRVIECAGRNDTLLTTLPSDKPTSFALNYDGSELYFVDDGKNQVLMIH